MVRPVVALHNDFWTGLDEAGPESRCVKGVKAVLRPAWSACQQLAGEMALAVCAAPELRTAHVVASSMRHMMVAWKLLEAPFGADSIQKSLLVVPFGTTMLPLVRPPAHAENVGFEHWLCGAAKVGVLQICVMPETTPGPELVGADGQLFWQTNMAVIWKTTSVPVLFVRVSGTCSDLPLLHPLAVAPVFPQAMPKSITGGGGMMTEALANGAPATTATAGTVHAAVRKSARRDAF
ncbi:MULTISPECIES: hypothetical protein [Arthrobacter]|uniref:Uncharacterized protein n=2 Tax=Arthrobacter TaxID=1663 RepID=A0ABU9KJS4_9MICC|nr:hypothetical protein [Arthrobacter sp. YJM1]MDP5226371.1 hypothetical protein [Arthrobacter sp. YJM1]